MTKIKASLILLLMYFLIGCSSSKFLSKNEEAKPTSTVSQSYKSLFYKDGQEAFYLKCDGPSWSECAEMAGNACKNKGYDVLEKNSVKVPAVIGSDKIQNEMYISCKVLEEIPKK
jgi:hypothetical protein